MALEGMMFEPIKAFNFRIELPPDTVGNLYDLFTLSVESASVNFVLKSGRIDVRDFSDSGQAGADLMRLYTMPVIPTFYISLLSPTGEVVRTYILKNNRMESVVVTMSNGPAGRRRHVTNNLYFKFDSFEIVPGSELPIPDGVRYLTLDYSQDAGDAEVLN